MESIHLTFWLAVLAVIHGEEYKIDQVPAELDTRLGKITGSTEIVLSKSIDVFLGIPYAKPPVGKKRFLKPEPYGSWSDRTVDASQLPNSCPQGMDLSFNSFIGATMWNSPTNISEDCLYLNIWAPNDRSDGARTVLVWIYGGGFSSGTSTLDWYDGRILAAQGDVVVVSMQYRVATMGFLSLGIPEVSGNMGLLDQQLALQWIYENIADYGGNPNSITLFGESAGAVSVGYHLVSKGSQNLFNRAIMQSATPMANWALDSPSLAKEKSLAIAAEVGCKDGSLQDIHACLMKVPHGPLTDAMWKIGESDESTLLTPLVPTVDGDFFTEHPLDIIDDNSIKMTNILLGVNSDEGAFFLPYQIPSIYNFTWDSVDSNEKYIEGVRQLMHVDHELVAQVVAFEYLKPYHYRRRPSYATLLNYILGDCSFTCPVVNFAQKYAEMKQGVYVYKFDHISPASPWPKRMGVLHGYEIDIVFGRPLNASLLEYKEEDKELSRRIIDHYVNFASTGDPSLKADNTRATYEWPRYTLEDRRVLVLNTTTPPVVQDGLKDRKCQFWNELLPQLRIYDRDESITCGSSLPHLSSLAASLSLAAVMVYIMCFRNIH